MSISVWTVSYSFLIFLKKYYPLSRAPDPEKLLRLLWLLVHPLQLSLKTLKGEKGPRVPQVTVHTGPRKCWEDKTGIAQPFHPAELSDKHRPFHPAERSDEHRVASQSERVVWKSGSPPDTNSATALESSDSFWQEREGIRWQEAKCGNSLSDL